MYCCTRIFASRLSLGTHERRAINTTPALCYCKKTADNSFFSDNYNVLDFILLSSAFASCIEYLINASQFQNSTTTIPEQPSGAFESAVLHTFRKFITFAAILRALRPLRALTSIPQVQKLLECTPISIHVG